jgi:hypothetical protein
MEKALTGLLEKYHVGPIRPWHLQVTGKEGELDMLPGYSFSAPKLQENQVPLPIWRVKRKFVELKKIVEESVIEDVCLFRFCCIGNKEEWSIFSLLYREMDLFEFIGNGKIISIKGVISGNEAGNLILRLDNNALCSIEVSTQLPSGSPTIDKHEIISRRGVASDVAVDTQIPQSSIYSYTLQGEKRYTDVDMELYGFDNNQIDHIRSAFQVLKQPELIQRWQSQHKRLVNFINYINSAEIL